MKLDRALSRDIELLVVIILVAVAARAVAFRGFSASDDADYALVAWDFAQGHFPPSEQGVPPHYPTRLGIIVPVGILFRVLGVHEWALLIVPLLMAAASLALAYALARTFFGHRAGLIAMAIYAVMPIEAQFSTWLLSDTAGSVWAAAGLLAVYLGSQRDTARGKAVAGLIAAACFGLSWVTRTQVAWLAPFVIGALIVWVWRDRRNLWLAGTLAVGVVAVLVAEGLLYLATTGDFLYVFHAMERLYQAHGQWYFKEGGMYGWEPGHYGLGLARRLLKMGPQTVFLNTNFALVPLVAAVAALHAALWRRREFAFPALWFAWSVLIFNFGSASLRHYEPLPWINSYLVPILLPATVVAAGWLYHMLSQVGDVRLLKERRFWAAMAALLILLCAAFGLYQHARLGIGCRGTRPAAKYLLAEKGGPIYTDAMTIRGLRFFWGYRDVAALHDYAKVSASDLSSNSRVLVNPQEIQRLKDVTAFQPPAYVDSPPETWKIEKRWKDTILYRVQ